MILKAQNDLKNNNYKRAVSYYEKAIKKWDDNKRYSFAKNEIEQEYIDAKKEYVDNLITDIKVSINDSNLDEAKKLLSEASKYNIKKDEIKNLKLQLKKINDY
jgi:glutathionylspermidine synthase